MKNLEIREILLKRVTEIVANEVNEQQENFLLMLLGTMVRVYLEIFELEKLL